MSRHRRAQDTVQRDLREPATTMAARRQPALRAASLPRALWLVLPWLAFAVHAGEAPLHIAGAGPQRSGLALYGCDSGVASAGWRLRYVAPGGSGDGQRLAPHGSLAAAVQAAGSQPTVYCVGAGSYRENVDLGSRRQAIVAGGFATDFATRAPADSPSRFEAANTEASVIRATSPRDLTLDGLEVTGSRLRGIEISLWNSAPPQHERVVLLNNHVHHNGRTTAPGGASASGGIKLGGGSFPELLIAHNLIEENDGWHHGGGLAIGSDDGNPLLRDGSNDGFGALQYEAPGLATVHHNIIRNNRIHEPGLPHGAGAAVGMNAWVAYNEFIGNDTVGNGSHYGVGGGLIAQHGVSSDSSNAVIVVQNNLFHRNRAGKAGSAVFLDQTHAGTVSGNLIVGNVGPGAVLVDGACSNSCAGPGGNHDRNFLTLVHNTIADNDGAGLYLQDSTAHLYFNLFWNNRAADDIHLANGSPGADNRLRGADNLLRTQAAGLQGSVNPGATGPLLSADYRLLAASLPGQALSSVSTTFAPALQFTGALQRSRIDADDLLGAPRQREDGRHRWGAFAALAEETPTAPPVRVFANGFEDE